MVAADAVAAAGAAPWPVGVCGVCERVESSKTSQIVLSRCVASILQSRPPPFIVVSSFLIGFSRPPVA